MSASGTLAALTHSGAIGFTKSAMPPVVGVSSLALGIAESASATNPYTALLGPFNIVAGGVVLVLYLFGKSLLRIAEKWLDSQGEKLIALPDAAELKADKASLFKLLEDMGRAAEHERAELGRFREFVRETIADHGARIKGLESRRSTDKAQS